MEKFRKIWAVFTAAEHYTFVGAAIVLIVALTLNFLSALQSRSAQMPIPGGEYREGIVGQPVFVNPIVAGANDADRDLVQLVFSNIKDLAESIKSDAEGRIWTVRLKENLVWQDGEPLTSDDVIYTIETVQDPDANSPLFQAWQGVIPERVSVQELRLLVRMPYAFFENNLEDLLVIPKHIFADVPPANFRLSDYNLRPIGSGPFKFVDYKKRKDGFVTDYMLEANEHYAGDQPLIKNMTLRFYSDTDRLITAFNNRQIDGFGGIDPQKLQQIRLRHDLFEISMPRYYAVFFNGNANASLREKNVRLALLSATDKAAMLKEIFDNRGDVMAGPISPHMDGYDPAAYPEESFSIETARQILESSGWKVGDDGIRTKSVNKSIIRLEFNLVVPQIDFLVKTAELLKTNWERIGVKLNLIVMNPKDVTAGPIRNRDYEMILFGNILNSVPDLFSFWHSSQRYFPGLNLALYDNKTADALMESVRRKFDSAARAEDLSSLQSLIYQDTPAIFLYSPNYLYVSIPQLYGFNDKFITTPSQRFEDIERWYLKSVRILSFD
ncbi:MAG: peptide ABC transporter substrate-binding protein [Parcubacteria group bacterium]|nr:peptide ABC transporter substrate-binding protein [Parcubacteria group bacterium]